ncbi:phosphotransferase family protein [Kribbella solani]|uniref:phosphotransferase family protein n=1 Tax=Kribbella solani TaxID=236067 RepID=UPI0029B1E53D|nr:phosphotransferase family protein [Kribbella solani]MDX2968150.1 phosphotransferase family protein [Kribbella solani]
MTSAPTDVAGVSVDVAGLGAYLARRVPDAGPLSGVELLTGGSSNLTLLATCAHRRLVVRRPPIGLIPEQSHDMRREHDTLRMIATTPVPVPTVHGYCGDESLLGAPFYVMDYVDGTVVQTADDLAVIRPSARIRICTDLVRILAELHAVPLPSFPSYQPGRSRNVMERHLKRWHERWRGRPHRDLPEVDRIAAELDRRLPASDALTFVHGDYRLGNTMVDRFGGDRPVLAVLDWELSTFGHPLTDLAHLLAYWEGTGEVRSHRAQGIAQAAGLLDAQAMAERYAAESGRDLEHLPVFLAFEHWRAAIIKEAIYQRRLRNGAAPADVDDARSGVDSHLAEAALRLAR